MDITMIDNKKLSISMSTIQTNQSMITDSSKHLTQIPKTKVKLKSNEHLTSPVNGVYIIPLDRTARAVKMLAEIPNHIGEYICQLCFQWFPDAFCLAEHPCSCMASLAYACEICGKVFNCPANLASHQRWHKPRIDNNHKNIRQMRIISNKRINNDKLQNPIKIFNHSSNDHVTYLLKQNSSSSELDRQQLSIYSEHINNVFKTSKHYRISCDEKMNYAQEYNTSNVQFNDSMNNHLTMNDTNVMTTTSTNTTNGIIHYSNSLSNKSTSSKQINPFSVEALLA
ncbi:insulinoma-associated protein (ia-1)-related [Schistosoma mansoni]|uniref:insulinoma-associated protein (ia-1)-related n=1 Tax=Schistosoma mansoni TaxID=6183 RepID=UPI0001A629F1|nr:insulinoma-associated protein (ia-1)-related [Schistosoma mansoni]|eukprot:XP_018648393.1 insulinoma-associated protein (ia-1)-related [Schistosoma mansoni]